MGANIVADIFARAWDRTWRYLIAIAVGCIIGAWVTVAIAGWL